MSAALSLVDEPGFEHLVHLYETDASLARCVLEFLSPGLADQAALVVATPEHRTLFANALEESGVDVEALRAEGRYVERDAEQLLATFLRDGVIDPLSFRLSVGESVRALAATHGRVHVYGEMVACLWGRGDSAAAVVLEHAWNDLAGVADFRLCCAYPVAAMTTGDRRHVDAALGCHSLVAD